MANETMEPDMLLLAAARLVDKVLAQLDSTSQPCKECARPHFTNRREAKLFEELANTPERLRSAASRLLLARTSKEDAI